MHETSDKERKKQQNRRNIKIIKHIRWNSMGKICCKYFSSYKCKCCTCTCVSNVLIFERVRSHLSANCTLYLLVLCTHSFINCVYNWCVLRVRIFQCSHSESNRAIIRYTICKCTNCKRSRFATYIGTYLVLVSVNVNAIYTWDQFLLLEYTLHIKSLAIYTTYVHTIRYIYCIESTETINRWE